MKKKTKDAVKEANGMDLLNAEDLKRGVLSLVSIIPNIKEYIAPTLNVTFNLQNDVGDFKYERDIRQ